VFEQLGARRRVTDFRLGKQLGAKDHLIDLTKPEKKPDRMTQEDHDKAPDRLIYAILKQRWVWRC